MKKPQKGNEFQEGKGDSVDVLKQKKKRLSTNDSGQSPPKKARKSEISSNLAENGADNKTNCKEEQHNKGKKFHTFNSKNKNAKKSLLSAKKSVQESEKASRKDIKKKYLDLKEQRKRKETTHYEIIVKAKKIWEELRQEKCPVNKRAVLIATLFDLLQGRLELFVFQHDTSRILQWLLKLGTPSIRLSICQGLKPFIRKMLLAKFSRFCVKNMTKYGDKACHQIVFNELEGHIVRLMASSVSAPVVEYMYSNFATTAQIRQFRCEFYGEMFKLFGTEKGKQVCLKDALSSGSMAKDIRTDVKANLMQVISKRVPVSQIMHSIILEFLQVCESGDRDEMIDALYSHVDELVKTREGAEILMRCCWFTSGKTRKAIVKSVKGRVVELCGARYGYLFLMALLDSVDDMVILQKSVFKELFSKVPEILLLENGWKLITYLVAHRDTVYFHPDLLSLLKTADTSEFIKKDANIKRAEILEAVMEPLSKSISQDASPWFNNPSTAIALTGILKAAKGDMWLGAMKTVSSYICQDNKIAVKDKLIPLIEHSSFNFVIKKIIKNEDEEGKAKLSYQLARQLTEEIIWKWIRCNRGCFLLTNILESKNNIAVQTLSGKITREMIKSIEKKKSAGEIALFKILSDLHLI